MQSLKRKPIGNQQKCDQNHSSKSPATATDSLPMPNAIDLARTKAKLTAPSIRLNAASPIGRFHLLISSAVSLGGEVRAY